MIIFLISAPVSYTHLDVYKRQVISAIPKNCSEIYETIMQAANTYIETLRLSLNLSINGFAFFIKIAKTVINRQ